VVLNADAVALLYGLPVAGILGSLWVIERARRRLPRGRLARFIAWRLAGLGAGLRQLTGGQPLAARGARSG
jgi:hypothetical protein